MNLCNVLDFAQMTNARSNSQSDISLGLCFVFSYDRTPFLFDFLNSPSHPITTLHTPHNRGDTNNRRQ